MKILIPIFSDAFLHPLHKDNDLSLLYVRSVGDREGKMICVNHPDCLEKESIDEIRNDHNHFYITPDKKKLMHITHLYLMEQTLKLLCLLCIQMLK